MSVSIRFSYHPRGWSLAFLLLMLGMAIGLLAFLAITESDRFIGMVLGAPWGAVIYGLLALGLAAAVVRFVLAAWTRREILFTEKTVSLPVSLTSKHILTLAYDDITSLGKDKAQRAAMTFIRIGHADGFVRISDLGFARGEDFEAVYDLLALRTGRGP